MPAQLKTSSPIPAPTAISSVYAMALSELPALRLVYAFPLIIGATLIFCLVLYIRFKRLRWL